MTHARHMRAEIASQPETWRQAIAQAGSGVPLPAAGEPVLFVGCGTSYYVGAAYARLRTSLGQGPTRAAIPAEIPYVDDAETVVVLSRSGTTRDVIDVARSRIGRRVIGIVATPGTPLLDECDDVIMMEYADEVAVVQTRFPTTVLTLLRTALGDEVEHLVADATTALTRALSPAAPEHVVFLGSGFALGLAHEAALKCLESSGRWAEAYPVAEYQHGPISAAGPGTVVWPLVPVPPLLADAIEATGATLLTPTLDPQAELVAAQRMAVEMAAEVGREPDVPPHLTRSVQAT